MLKINSLNGPFAVRFSNCSVMFLREFFPQIKEKSIDKKPPVSPVISEVLPLEKHFSVDMLALEVVHEGQDSGFTAGREERATPRNMADSSL